MDSYTLLFRDARTVFMMYIAIFKNFYTALMLRLSQKIKFQRDLS
jgi:hypothetical protein